MKIKNTKEGTENSKGKEIEEHGSMKIKQQMSTIKYLYLLKKEMAIGAWACEYFKAFLFCIT